jgi:hypothetical protein
MDGGLAKFLFKPELRATDTEVPAHVAVQESANHNLLMLEELHKLFLLLAS